MSATDAGRLILSFVLILATAFFVAAEYALVGTRRSRVEAEGKGNKVALGLLKILDDVSAYIAGTQIAITMLGIAMGSFAEPFITELIVKRLSWLDARIGQVLSFMVVVFLMVVLGELVPKYWALRSSEKVALRLYRPLRVVVALLKPIIIVAQWASAMVLRPFGIRVGSHRAVIQKEELLLLVEAGEEEGVLDKSHAEMVARALRLDKLCARDMMIHRLDVRWLDVDSDKEVTLRRLRRIPYQRIPVCRGDLDDIVGIVYLHDIVRTLNETEFSLERIARSIVAVPENLAFERVVQTMREEQTQIVVVMDEYGGTSGILTLEDVVEEIFGELQDRIESERPLIDIRADGSISARAEVRFDEIIDRLDLDYPGTRNTDTLATIIVDELSRIPVPGDTIQTDIGSFRVENMTRRRITRVSIELKKEYERKPEA